MKLKVGVSSCLMGNKVRYDGSHQKHSWLSEDLIKHIDYLPVCPEMSMGLGTPREPLRIVRDSSSKEDSLKGSKSAIDRTDLAINTNQRLLDQLGNEMDGFILMSNSPLCGTGFVKVYESKNNIPHKDGQGYFAAAIAKRHPYLPVTESYRLQNQELREAFLSHLFFYHQARKMERTPRALQDLHSRHKFLFLSYNPRIYRNLGPLVAHTTKENFDSQLDIYLNYVKEVFSSGRKKKYGHDSLLHLYGFVKNKIDGDVKQYLLEAIERYRKGYANFQLPLSLIYMANIKAGNEFLSKQVIFAPYDETLNIKSG